MPDTLKTFYFLAFLAFLLTAGNCSKAKAANDEQFEIYLTKAMKRYSDWVQENGFDPSPMTNDSVAGSRDGVTLDCQLSNHYVRRYADKGQLLVGFSESNFIQHSLEMGRQIFYYHEYIGDFVCSGLLSHYNFPELSSDLAFSGHGHFNITSESSFDYLTLRNVGITQEYKLDLSLSRPSYLLQANQDLVYIEGEWNETLISSTYLDAVENVFAYRYYMHPMLYTEGVRYPTGHMLEKYVLQVAQAVDLREIINEEDLPPPYVPTPMPN